MAPPPDPTTAAPGAPAPPATNGASAAARAAERRSTVRAVVGLVAVLTVLFWEGLTGDGVLTQADALLQFEPWAQAAPADFEPSNPLLLDQSLVVQPWLEFAREEVAKGRFPHWNPYNYAGQPLHAAYTGAFLWPLNWLYLSGGSWGSLVWIALLKLALGGVGTFVFLRRWGLRATAAGAGAVGFALCGFNIVWLGHPHTNVAALVPWALVALGALAERPVPRRAAAVALVAGAMLVAGHIQTAVHAGLVLIGYVLFRATTGSPERPRMGRRALLLAGGGALTGALLAAPALLPFAEYLGHSRAATLFEEVEVTSSVGLSEVAPLLVAPDLYGNPSRGDYTGPVGDNLNYSELVGPFAGRILLLAALLGCVLRWRDGRVRFLAGLLVFSLLVAWQVPPLYDLLREVPKLRSTKLMRMGLFAAFAICCLGAIGIDAAVAHLRQHLVRRSVGLALAAAVAVEMLLFARGFNPIVDRSLVLPSTPTVEYLVERGAADSTDRVLGVAGTHLFPGANLFHRLALPTGYDSIEDQRLAQLVGQLTSDPRAEAFVKEIGYFDRPIPLGALLGIRWVLSAEALPPPFERVHTAPTGLSVWERAEVQPRAFLARAARRVDDDAERLELLGAADFDPTVALFEGPPPADAAAYDGPRAPGRAELVEYAPGRVRVDVEVEAPALLVFTETFDPGWRAHVDGRPREVQRIDHALSGIWLQNGDGTVEIRYASAAFRFGLVLAGLALAAIVAASLPRHRRDRP